MIGVLLGLAIAAQLPEPQILGPDQLAAGRLGVFSVDAPEGAKTVWRVFPPESSNLTETDVAAVFEANRKLAFASPVPGTYRLVVAVSYGDDLFLLDRVLPVVGGPSPPPVPPPPDPEPEPQPPSTWAQWAARVATETVPQPFRTTEGRTVARALRTVVDAITAGRITEPRKAREAVRQTVREHLGSLEAIRRWEPFSSAFDEKMDAEQDKLKTIEDYKQIWIEVAVGLESNE